MSADWNSDDFARLLALEHAFSALAVISASNFAYNEKVTSSEAVAMFRHAIASSVEDTTQFGPAKSLVSGHLKRMFDHVAVMAKMSDEGPKE